MKLQSIVAEADAGRRLDRFVQAALGNVPPSLVQRLLREGKVRLNAGRGRPGDRIVAGDEVVIHHQPRPADAVRAARPGPSPPHSGQPPLDSAAPLRGPLPAVLYENARFLLVDKPAGLPCHAPAGAGPSVLAWAAQRYAPGIASGRVRPALANRLDKDTTGIVVIALSAAAVADFQRLLAQGRVTKTYLVAVWGTPPADAWRIELPLVRRPHGPRTAPKVVAAADAPGARASCTALRVLARGTHAALLAATPVTGRTHQIRAHLKAAGLPIVGDPRYGDPSRDRTQGVAALLRRQLLHAALLAFTDGDRPVRAAAPLPGDARAALARLGLPAADPELLG